MTVLRIAALAGILAIASPAAAQAPASKTLVVGFGNDASTCVSVNVSIGFAPG